MPASPTPPPPTSKSKKPSQLLDARHYDPTLNGEEPVIGAAALGLGGLLSACAPTASNGIEATITHWDWFVLQEPWVTSEIALFEKANPSLMVKRTLNQFDQYANLISLAQRSKSLPDVYMLPYQQSLEEQVAGGWLRPLNEYVDESWIRSYPKCSFIEGANA